MVRDIDGTARSAFRCAPAAIRIAALLESLARARLHVLTLADALDLDTLRLLGMLGPESTAAGALAHVDLLCGDVEPGGERHREFFARALAERARNASHAKRPARMRCTVTAGIGRKGSLDSLVLTELAWDDDGVRAPHDRERDSRIIHARASAR